MIGGILKKKNTLMYYELSYIQYDTLDEYVI